MRRWSLIVALAATLALGASACGLKEADDAGDLSIQGAPTTEAGSDPAGPATGAPSTDDTTADDPFGDPFNDPGASGGDFCSLAKESPDPTSIAAGDEFFARWRAAAPEELYDEIDVVTDWYEQSKTDPDMEMPEDVLDALVSIGRYTVENCT